MQQACGLTALGAELQLAELGRLWLLVAAQSEACALLNVANEIVVLPCALHEDVWHVLWSVLQAGRSGGSNGKYGRIGRSAVHYSVDGQQRAPQRSCCLSCPQ
jgi:hypothetical protein